MCNRCFPTGSSMSSLCILGMGKLKVHIDNERKAQDMEWPTSPSLAYFNLEFTSVAVHMAFMLQSSCISDILCKIRYRPISVC